MAYGKLSAFHYSTLQDFMTDKTIAILIAAFVVASLLLLAGVAALQSDTLIEEEASSETSSVDCYETQVGIACDIRGLVGDKTILIEGASFQ